MILCCAPALRLLKQNEQLKKHPTTKSKQVKINERALKLLCFYDVSGLKNVFTACCKQEKILTASVCYLVFPQSSISCSS